jgi:hypothetical protein
MERIGWMHWFGFHYRRKDKMSPKFKRRPRMVRGNHFSALAMAIKKQINPMPTEEKKTNDPRINSLGMK